jgi:hypothetical protein
MRAPSKFLLVAIAAGVATTAAAAQPAAAPVSAVNADVRCLLTMVALGHDKQRQQAAVIGSYFFMGRISARVSKFDLMSAAKAQAPTLGPAELTAEFKRCAPMVASAEGALKATFSPPAAARPPGAASLPPAAAPAPAPK